MQIKVHFCRFKHPSSCWFIFFSSKNRKNSLKIRDKGELYTKEYIKLIILKIWTRVIDWTAVCGYHERRDALLVQLLVYSDILCRKGCKDFGQRYNIEKVVTSQENLVTDPMPGAHLFFCQLCGQIINILKNKFMCNENHVMFVALKELLWVKRDEIFLKGSVAVWVFLFFRVCS